MADLDELYRRVDICERLLNSLGYRNVKADTYFGPQRGGFSGGGGINGPEGGGILYYELFMFPFNDEAHIIHNDKSYNLNFAIGAFIGNNSAIIGKSYITFRQNGTFRPWINISKSELLFLDKTIYNVANNYDLLLDPIENGGLSGQAANDMFVDITTYIEREQLWNKIKKQLILADDVVETITRETINQALFESRLKIHEIKTPPYVIGNGNPLLTPRMNQFMPTDSPPVTLRPISPKYVRPKHVTPKQVRPRLRPQIPENTNTHSSPILSQMPIRSTMRTPRHSLNRAPRKSRRNKNRQYSP